MPFSSYKSTGSHRTNNGTSFRATASVLIIGMVATLFPVLVEAAGEQARSAMESVIKFFAKNPSNNEAPGSQHAGLQRPVDPRGRSQTLALVPAKTFAVRQRKLHARSVTPRPGSRGRTRSSFDLGD